MKGALPLITYATLITHLATLLPDVDVTDMTAMVAALPIDPHTPYHDGSSEPTQHGSAPHSRSPRHGPLKRAIMSTRLNSFLYVVVADP